MSYFPYRLLRERIASSSNFSVKNNQSPSLFRSQEEYLKLEKKQAVLAFIGMSLGAYEFRLSRSYVKPYAQVNKGEKPIINTECK